jgi:hypothetical protein
MALYIYMYKSVCIRASDLFIGVYVLKFAVHEKSGEECECIY